jgi:hypothetical protein
MRGRVDDVVRFQAGLSNSDFTALAGTLYFRGPVALRDIGIDD